MSRSSRNPITVSISLQYFKILQNFQHFIVKQNWSLPITLIFNENNYYNKSLHR